MTLWTPGNNGARIRIEISRERDRRDPLVMMRVFALRGARQRGNGQPEVIS